MPFGSNIVGGSSVAGLANVDSNFNLKTNLPTVIAQAGFVGLAGVVDDGTVVAGGRQNRVYVSEGNGLYAASKNMLWDDAFNATTQNTSNYKTTFTTMTPAASGGFLNLNSTAITTINTNCIFQTFKNFPLFGKAELRINVAAQIPNGNQANQTIEWGAFNASGATAPTDGVFWRCNTAGELRGVSNYNGTETQTAAMTMPSTSVTHDWDIIIQTNFVGFYVDDVLYGKINLPVDAPTLGQPMMAASMPLTFRTVIAGSAPALAPQIKIANCFVNEMGPDLARPWSTQKSGMGHMAAQGQNGGTMGSTANLTNAALAAASALSNTAVGTGNPAGLGGYSHDLCTLTAGTDGIVTSYQNPAGAVGQTPRNLIIQGVWIHSVVDAAITGGPFAFLYSLAYGHTAVSLATTETASFATATTKAPRRIALGVEGAVATAAAGTLLSPQGVYRQFISPIVVAPGEFVAVVGRNLGTVASAGSVVHAVGFDAYME